MKPNAYELRIMNAVKTLRKLKDLKLINIAFVLNTSESNYCKIENGRKALTLAQLEAIAVYFKTTVIQIIALGEADYNGKFELNPLSKILVEHVLLLAKRGEDISFTKEELERLISKIREHYEKP